MPTDAMPTPVTSKGSSPNRARLQLAFLTGQSDPQRCALSPVQRAFGEALLTPNRWLRANNFPYWVDAGTYHPVPLWRASWHNTRQYFNARRAACVALHRDAVLQMLDAAPHTVVLAGSCGLELLSSLALPEAMAQRLSVLAYGPVARQDPRCAHLLTVAGRADWVSRLGYGRTMQRINGGHMDSLQQPALLSMAQAFIAAVEASLECSA